MSDPQLEGLEQRVREALRDLQEYQRQLAEDAVDALPPDQRRALIRQWTRNLAGGGALAAAFVGFGGWLSNHRGALVAAFVGAVVVAAAVFWFRPGDEQPGAPLGPMPTATVTIAGPTVISTPPQTSVSPSPPPLAVTPTPTIVMVSPTTIPTVATPTPRGRQRSPAPTAIPSSDQVTMPPPVRVTVTTTTEPTTRPPATEPTPTRPTMRAQTCLRVRLHPVKAVVCVRTLSPFQLW